MKALEHLNVLDFTRVLAGPFASMLLADMGAEVIKIEAREKGDDARAIGPFVKDESLYFMSLNRGKKSITLDLKTEEGKAIIKDLVKNTDILLENFRAGVMDRLGLGYDVLKEINPRLIYVACTGFGQTGPYRGNPSYDIIMQGLGGLMSITGKEGEGPLCAGASFGDLGGALYSTIGALTAVVARQETGKGQFVDIGMLDCQVSLLENAVTRCLNTGVIPKPIGNRHPSITPFTSFRAQDGFIILAIGNDAQWARFCTYIDRPEWITNPRFSTNAARTENNAELKFSMAPILGKRTMQDWIDNLTEIGIPISRINNIGEVVTDPQVLSRNMIIETEHPSSGKVRMPGVAIKLSDTPGSVERPAPTLGQHTEEILMEKLGMTAAEVEELRRKNII